MDELENENNERSQPLIDYNAKVQMIDYSFDQTSNQIEAINNILLSLSYETSSKCKSNLMLMRSSMNHLTAIVASLKAQLDFNSSDMQFKLKLITSSTNLNNKYESMKRMYHQTSRYFISTVSKEQLLTQQLDNSSDQTEAQSKTEVTSNGTKLKSTEELKEIKAIDDYFEKTTNDINTISELCGNKMSGFDHIEGDDIFLFFDNNNYVNKEDSHAGFKWNTFIISLILGSALIFISIFVYLRYCVQFA